MSGGLRERLLELDDGLPARFEERGDGTLGLELAVAERKTFLSRQRLTYRARLRIDDERREVRFFEVLREQSRGLVGGLDVRLESYRLRGKEREGSLRERSRYLGKDYAYAFDYGAVRRLVEREAAAAGYSFSLRLLERQL